jgi:hypothetical protein
LRLIGGCLDAHLQEPVLANGAEVIDSFQMFDHINTRDRGEHLEAQIIIEIPAYINYPLWRNLDANHTSIQPPFRDWLTNLLIELSKRVEQIVDMVTVVGKQRWRPGGSRCAWRYIQRMTPFRQA